MERASPCGHASGGVITGIAGVIHPGVEEFEAEAYALLLGGGRDAA